MDIENRKSSGGIGILGGTFDPIHLGHVAIARAVKEHLGLTDVYIVPAHKNPLRQGADTVAGSRDRLEMARMATVSESWLHVDPVEIERGNENPEPSFTIDTLEYFRDRIPDAEMTLIVGADNVAFQLWHRVEEFPDYLARIAIVSRPGYTDRLPEALEIVERECPAVHAIIEVLPIVEIPISSTAIRESLHNGQMPTECLHPAVERYIREHGLYGLDGGDLD